jgi:threonine dehydrogenase-like Zn-dependent dehydrogenase
MSRFMKAARLHEPGQRLRIDEVEVPEPGPTDVLVQVKACGIVPNLANVLTRFADQFPNQFLPVLPAIFGLDATGVVVEKGAQAHGVDIGTRVYVNPARHCGACRACRRGRTTHCRFYAFNGYFGFTPDSHRLHEDYPFGGLGEFMTAPQYSLVTLPDNVSHEAASRFGYLGTAFRALRRAGIGPGDVVLVNGVSGTLGLGAALLALALGARQVLGTGRDRDLLERVRALDPGRIAVHAAGDEQSVAEWARDLTGGDGADIVIDSLGNGTPPQALLEALAALGRGGTLVNIGAVAEPVPIRLHEIMERDQRILGSVWFTTAQGQEMAELVAQGSPDLSLLEHEIVALADVNDGLETIANRSSGGFTNYVIRP